MRQLTVKSVIAVIALATALVFPVIAAGDQFNGQGPAAVGTTTIMGQDASSFLNSIDFTPEPGDVSVAMLHQIFGDASSNTLVPLVGGAMLILNVGAMVIGALLFLLMAGMGFVKTAEEGELLGKWSSHFLPLRLIGAQAALVPTASGYSMAQILVMWVIGQGVGIANWIWIWGVGTFFAFQSAIVTQTAPPADVRAAMVSIFESEYCAALMNQKYPGQNWSLHPAGSSTKQAVWGPDPDAQSIGFPLDYCGSIALVAEIKKDDIDIADITGATTSVDISDAVNVLGNGVASGLSAAIANIRPLAQDLSINQAEVALNPNPAANRNVALTQKGINLQFSQATTAYTNTMAAANIGVAIGKTKDLTARIVEDAAHKGWITAGTWMFQFALIQSELNKLSMYIPTTTPPTISSDGFDAASSTYAKTIASRYAVAPNGKELLADNEAKNVTDEKHGSIAKLLGAPLTRVLAKFAAMDAGSKNHPLVQIKNAGDYLMGTAEVVGVSGFAAMMLPAVANDLAGKVGLNANSSLGVALQAMSLGLYTTVAVLFAVGISLSIVTPMLPAMHWLGGCIGWMLAVVEIVVATPIWMVFHAHPEGHEAAGKGAAGYMLLLEAVTRPMFMLCGLIFGYLIVVPSMTLVQMIFFRSMSSVQTNSTTGIVTMVMVIVLYAGFCHSIVRKCFTAINVLPSQIYRAIGGMNAGGSGFTEGVGSDAQRAGDHAAGHLGKIGAGSAAFMSESKKRNAGGGNRSGEQRKNSVSATPGGTTGQGAMPADNNSK